jgi:hypothetical protein
VSGGTAHTTRKNFHLFVLFHQCSQLFLKRMKIASSNNGQRQPEPRGGTGPRVKCVRGDSVIMTRKNFTLQHKGTTAVSTQMETIQRRDQPRRGPAPSDLQIVLSRPSVNLRWSIVFCQQFLSARTLRIKVRTVTDFATSRPGIS